MELEYCGKWKSTTELRPFLLEIVDTLPSQEKVEGRASNKGLLPLTLDDYLTLLDWSGRQLQAGRSGVIPSQFAPNLERLCMSSHIWTELATKIERWFIPIAKPAGSQAAGVTSNPQQSNARYYEDRG